MLLHWYLVLDMISFGSETCKRIISTSTLHFCSKSVMYYFVSNVCVLFCFVSSELISDIPVRTVTISYIFAQRNATQ